MSIVLNSPDLAELSVQKSGQIGMESGPPEQLLTMVTTTTATPDGGVIFFDGGVREIRWFDSTLRFVRTVARQGSGPGEIPPSPTFNASPGIVIEDRTIWKIGVDGQRRIVALFATRERGALLYDARGVFVNTWNFARQSGTNLHEASLSPDNLLHTRHRLPAPSGSCTGTNGEPICLEIAIRHRLDGAIVDTIPAPRLRWTIPMLYYTATVGPPTATTRQKRFVRAPFAPYPILSFSEHGYWVTAQTDKYEVVLHRLIGGPLLVRSSSPPVPLESGERRATFDRLAAQFRGNLPASTVTLSDIPTVKPPVRDVRSDADGRIWVQLHSPATPVVVDPPPAQAGRGRANAPPSASVERWVEPVIFDLFAPTGDYLGRLRLPATGTMMSSAGPYLWIREEDSIGVQRLVRYTISARSPRSPAAEYWARR